MKKKYVIALVVSFFLFNVSISQNTQLAKADKEYERLSYINAIEIYKKVVEQGYKSPELYKKIGNSYYFNSDYEKAVKWYRRLIENYEKNVSSEYFFRYAQSLKAIKLYKQSDTFMQKFYAMENGNVDAKKIKGQKDYLKEISFQSGRYKLSNIKANSPFSDFGPAFYGEKIVFASSRDTGTFSKRIHKWNNRPFLDLFVGDIDKNTNNIKEVESLSPVLNSKFHESTPVFTKDKRTVYFTRNNFNNGVYGKSKTGINKLKIYRSHLSKETNEWSQPESISINSDEYVTAHPALGPYEKRLYFSSTKKGGKGLSDLYVVDIYNDGNFGKPINLGERVNTEGVESFPFVDPVNNDLYFASNGQVGLGGLDIFVIKLDNNGLPIGEATNIGKPANSSDDDFAFILDAKTKTGYLSSNRSQGKGDDDIYSFVQIEKLKRDCNLFLNGIVSDRETGEVISNAKVTIFNTSNKIIGTTTVGSDGKFKFNVSCSKNYFLRAEREDYETHEKLVSTPQDKIFVNTSINLNNVVKKAEVGSDLGKILSLNPIYFDYNNAEIRYDAELELAKVIAVLNRYPKMKIDIRSHTDSRGNDNYNLMLSDKRAKATMRHILKKGKISKDRVTGKGYGESQLINGCSNGSDCLEEEHQLNRRSEFIIIEQ